MTLYLALVAITLHAASDDSAASAEAQLAVAQSALCRMRQAQTPIDKSECLRFERLAQAWVDAWDTAGRPPEQKAAMAKCGQDQVSGAYLEALIQMTQAHFDAAQTSLAQAMQLAPAAWCPALRLRQGLCALHRHKPQKALDLLQTAQKYAPERVAIRLATAQAYLSLNRPADSVASLKPILTQATEAPDGREIEQARALVGMAIEQDAGHISPLERTAMQNLLAMAQSADADGQTAEMALSLAEAVPRPRVQTAAALVALKMQQVATGRRLLVEAFTHAGLDPDPARLLALYNVEHAGPVAALPCLALAAERDPFNVETQVLIADLQERTGDVPAARTTLEALIRLEPNQPRHKAALSRLQDKPPAPAVVQPNAKQTEKQYL